MTTTYGATTMPVPDVDTSAAREVAVRLRAASRLAGAANEALTKTAPAVWSGFARDAYLHQRGRASGRLDATAGFASTVSEAIDRYADDVDAAMRRMRQAGVDLDTAVLRRATACTEPDEAATVRMVDEAWANYDAAQQRYENAVTDLARSLDDVPTFPDADLSLGEHWRAGADRFVQEAVVGPFDAARLLALGWVDDPQGWRAMVGAIPGSLWDQVTHPRRTANEMLALDDLHNDQVGAAIGTWASMAAIPGKALKAMASPEIRTKYARNMADPNAPRPRVQTVDEMMAGVNLAAHEHHALGHAIRRHVDVDDDYLRDRLDHGTLLDNGRRGFAPKDVSAWHDLPTAEREITAVLRQHEGVLRDFAEGDQGRLVLRGLTDQPVGRVLTRVHDEAVLVPSRKVLVSLRRKDGELVIETAYLEKP